jgi:hypothetical protein
LVWIGLWTAADDAGRLVDELGILTGDLWALSLSEPKLDKVLDELDAAGRIFRYESAGQRFIQITGWDDHQKINRPSPSSIPPLPLTEDSVNAHGGLTGGKEGKGKERRGSVFAGANTEPPNFCPDHPNGSAGKPCGPCADARRAHDAWATAEKSKPTPIPPRADEVPEHEHRWLTNGTCSFPNCAAKQ